MRISITNIMLMVTLLLGTPVGAQSEGNTLFRDDFDGAGIGDQWEVVNPDPDNAIVEEGMLQMITQVPEKKLFNAKNMLFYKGDLPREYEVEARVITSLAATNSCGAVGVNSPFTGVVLKQDDNNAILLAGGRSLDACDDDSAIVFLCMKNGRWEPGFWRVVGGPQSERPVRLKLVRKGRVFEGYYLVKDKKGKRFWRLVGAFPLIHAEKYRIGLIAARGNGKTHEQLNKVDWVEIRTLKK